MADWLEHSQFGSLYLMKWIVQTPHGFSWQAMCVDLPQAGVDAELAANAWNLCLAAFWAPLATLDSAVVRIEAASLSQLGAGYVLEPQGLVGTQFGATARLDDSMVWMILTGHNDAWGRRRLYFPGTPASWVSEGRIKRERWGQIQSIGRGFISALGHEREEYTLCGLIYRPALPDHPIIPYRSAGFRRYLSVRILTNTDKCPPIGTYV